MIAFHELDEHRRHSLLAASARHFGAGSYQADDRYLRWLYQRNPAASGLSDAILAVQDGRVVGCMHRLMLPICGGGRMAALHNHFVDPSGRSGSGVLLLRRATRDTVLAVAPGVEEKLGPIYHRLRFHEVAGSWLQKPLSYAGIAAGLLRERVGLTAHVRMAGERATDEVIVTGSPSDRQLQDLCAAMRRRYGDSGVDWSEPMVCWRYFDAEGPRHLLVRARGSAAYAVLAIGRRKGVTTMRIMDIDDAGTPGWTPVVEHAGRRAGAALGLAFTTDPDVVAGLRSAGWRPRAGKTFTFSTEALDRLAPAATDLGFEAMSTEVV